MGQLVRRFSSRERGSALTEYALILAALAIGVFAALLGFRDAIGDLTSHTSVTISRQSGGGGGGGSGGGRGGWSGKPTPADETPVEPEPSEGDSTGTSTAIQDAAGR